MDSTLEIFLIATMALVAISSVAVVAHRIASRGKWAGGYWWSGSDRRHGPGT